MLHVGPDDKLPQNGELTRRGTFRLTNDTLDGGSGNATLKRRVLKLTPSNLNNVANLSG